MPSNERLDSLDVVNFTLSKVLDFLPNWASKGETFVFFYIFAIGVL